MRKIGLFLFVFVLGTTASAQKIKYKDLYILLAAKDYDQGEKFLRDFLVQDPDHPNANLNMAYFYSYKMDVTDMLKETSSYLAYGDSANTYYNKAYGLINEKEVKKNDEYYQDFYRRDLRTGKYGVKLADVQLDIETRMSALKKLLDNVGLIGESFKAFQTNYDSAAQTYNTLVSDYSSRAELLYNASEEQMEIMGSIANFYAKAISSFESYSEALSSIEEPPYNQQLEIQRISGLDTPPIPDFFTSTINLYNYGEWADGTREEIASVITPMLEQMISYNAELDDLLSQARNGKNAGEALDTFREGVNFEPLKTYDEQPIPLALFAYKENGVQYFSSESQKVIDQVYDSLSYSFQKSQYEDALSQLDRVEDSYEGLIALDFSLAESLYSSFMTAAKTDKLNLLSAIGEMHTSYEIERAALQAKLDSILEVSAFARTETMAIPMSLTDSLTFPVEGDTLRFTFHIDSLAHSYRVSGLEIISGVVNSYIASVDLMMHVDTLFHSKLFEPTTPIEQLQNDVFVTERGKVYVFYGQDGESKHCLVQFADPNGDVTWSSRVEKEIPYQSVQSDDEGNLVLYFADTGEGGEVSETIVLDAQGNLL